LISRPLGATGVVVPALGLGAAAVGDPAMSEEAAGTLLNAAVDLGVTLVDTARSYGLSEERIGRHLSWRRSDVVLSTKVGYGVPGVDDWTGPCVTAGVERALALLRTDVIDVVHLHSCPLAVLERGDVVRALSDAVGAGKARVAAYSGENEALAWALDSGAFGAVQTSVNVCDQASLARPGGFRGRGVLSKRTLANAAWLGRETLDDEAATEYRRRWDVLELWEVIGRDPAGLAARFAAFAPGVSCALVGTRRLESLRWLVDAVAEGPLPDDVRREVEARFAARGAGWPGMI